MKYLDIIGTSLRSGRISKKLSKESFENTVNHPSLENLDNRDIMIDLTPNVKDIEEGVIFHDGVTSIYKSSPKIIRTKSIMSGNNKNDIKRFVDNFPDFKSSELPYTIWMPEVYLIYNFKNRMAHLAFHKNYLTLMSNLFSFSELDGKENELISRINNHEKDLTVFKICTGHSLSYYFNSNKKEDYILDPGFILNIILSSAPNGDLDFRQDALSDLNRAIKNHKYFNNNFNNYHQITHVNYLFFEYLTQNMTQEEFLNFSRKYSFGKGLAKLYSEEASNFISYIKNKK